MRWLNRAQFFGIAAQIMSRILVDYARSRSYLKICYGVSVSCRSRHQNNPVPIGRTGEIVELEGWNR